MDSRQCMEGEEQLSRQRIFQLISSCCTEAESHILCQYERMYTMVGVLQLFILNAKKKIRSHQLAGRLALSDPRVKSRERAHSKMIPFDSC